MVLGEVQLGSQGQGELTLKLLHTRRRVFILDVPDSAKIKWDIATVLSNQNNGPTEVCAIPIS